MSVNELETFSQSVHRTKKILVRSTSENISNYISISTECADLGLLCLQKC